MEIPSLLSIINTSEQQELISLLNNKIFRQMINNLPAVLFTAIRRNDNWVIDYVSDNCERLYGYKAEEITGKKEQDYNLLVIENKRERLVSKILTRNIGETDLSYTIDYLLVTKNKGIKHVIEKVNGFFNQENKLVMIAGCLFDNSEMKNLQEEITFQRRNKNDTLNSKTDNTPKEDKYVGNKEFFNFVSDYIKQGIWDWDVKNDLIWFNKEYMNITGYNFKENVFRGRNWFENKIHPDDMGKINATLSGLIHTQENTFENEYRLKRGDSDEYMWINSRGQVIERDSSGKATRIISFQSDISEKKAEENNIKNNYNLIYTMADSIPLPVYFETKSGIMKYGNNSFYSFTKCSKESIIGKTSSFVWDELIRTKTNFNNEVLFNGKEYLLESVTIKRNDKQNKLIIYRQPLYFEKNGMCEIVNVIINIQELNEARSNEKGIKQQDNLLKSIIKYMPVIVWGVDNNDNFTYCAGLGLNMLNLKSEDIIGESIYKIADIMNADKNIINFVKQGNEYKGIIRYNDYYLENYIVPIKDSNGLVKDIIGFSSDITEKVKIQEEYNKIIEDISYNRDLIENSNSELILMNAKLEESEKALYELNASKDKFFTIIAHDLKGPFGSVLGLTELLAESYSNSEESSQKEIVDVLYSSAKKTLTLLENLLEWSRLQIGRYELDKTIFDLSYINQNVINILSLKAEKKNIRILNRVLEGSLVYADQGMIETVMRNLITNALKFTGDNGLVDIYYKEENNYGIITVQDSGIGLEQEDIKKLFRIDISFSTTGLCGEKGTGIGLVLCKELVEKNGGKIWVESEKNKGSRFSFSLPVRG